MHFEFLNLKTDEFFSLLKYGEYESQSSIDEYILTIPGSFPLFSNIF
jgi:hypothetical protein